MSVLMLANVHPAHAAHSGYNRLPDYVSGAEFITAPRRSPTAFWPKMGARVARRFSFSRWYIGGSAVLEWRARRRLATFDGVVHSLWSDHDLGFLDLLLDRRRHRLCGTFHNCSDTFVHTIRFPARIRKFRAVILMSETQRPFFLAAGVPAERIHVVLHGIDTDYFQPAPGDPATTVLSVGGYRRDFPLLREVCRALPEVPFRIVAPEAFRPLFTNLGNVTFLHGLDDARLREEYRQAACLLHTAENATANNALLEAMACGVPIVAERVGGIPEYVNAGAAILTEPLDVAALAAGVQRCLASEPVRREMRAAGRRRAEELSWPKVAERMAEIYRAL